jgi:twinfilin-like protein
MQSGISASKELHEQFNQLLSTPDAFALVVSIAGEALVPVELLSAPSPTASFDDSLDVLAPHLQPRQAAYALLRRHAAAPHLVAVTASAASTPTPASRRP